MKIITEKPNEVNLNDLKVRPRIVICKNPFSHSFKILVKRNRPGYPLMYEWVSLKFLSESYDGIYYGNWREAIEAKIKINDIYCFEEEKELIEFINKNVTFL